MNDLMDFLLNLAPALAALISVVGGMVLRARDLRADTLRANLERDAKIYSALPESGARRKLEQYISERVDNLKTADSGSRNWTNFFLALLFTPLLGYSAIWLWGLNQIWAYIIAIGVGFLSAASFYGVFESLQKKDRSDEQKRDG